MTVRRLYLLVNPHAGGGRARRLLPAVAQALRQDGHDLDVATTRSLAHAGELAEQAVAHERTVVAMGGDGLVGRVAGVVAARGGVLAVIPGGRGNDLCRAVGIPRRAVPAAAVIAAGQERTVDLGVVTSAQGAVTFLGIASVGFDSDVQERALVTRLRLGRAVYVTGALMCVLRWRPAAFTLVADAAPTTVVVRGWTVAVANSGVYGGGMRLAPAARLDDGALDVVTVSASSRARFAATLPQVFLGRHVRSPLVEITRAATVQLSADRPFRVFADGEPAGSLPCTVTVRPGALRLIGPRRE